MAGPASSRPRVIRFGVFELDPCSGELRKAGVRVTLQDQPLKLLECLLERPGELVTRDELRGRLWPGDTFVDFEQGVNAAVRRLREALADSADSPRFVETLPRRGYRFIAPVERDGGPPAGAALPATRSAGSGEAAANDGRDTPSPRASRWLRAALGASVIAIVLAVGGWAWLRRPTPAGAAATPAPEVIPLTTLNGSEQQPTFSPDGSQVAFAWDGDAPHNVDIYVTLVGSSQVRRLTIDPGRDFAPQWSPDGRQIAYVRGVDPFSQRLRAMSALGGSDRELSDLPVFAPVAWSPDGRFLAAGRAGNANEVGRAHAIYLIPTVAGDPRALTRPEGDTNDWSPAFSPNGRRLAYASCGDLVFRSVCHVQVLDLEAGFTPIGAPRRLTRESVWTINGLTWSRDGMSVIYSAHRAGLVQMWRADADGARPPERIAMAGMDVLFPAIARSGERLAYTHAPHDMDIYRLDPLDRPNAERPIARSSTRDTLPQFSPDGRRIAYCSAREADAFEVWIADLDGSPPERLTHGPGQWQCSPVWAPDGTRIAFDSRAEDGSWHVWTISANGGVPQQVTTEAGDQVRPSWSRDGHWIYFVWKRAHDRDVWRRRLPAGPVERVTQGGSSMRAASESVDGTGVWYKHEQADGPLLFQPLAGGAARAVIPCVSGPRFFIGVDGVYYMPCRPAGDTSHDAPVRVHRLATGEDRQFATLTGVRGPAGTLTSFVVSPNGRTLLYNRLASREADLMLIERFR